MVAGARAGFIDPRRRSVQGDRSARCSFSWEAGLRYETTAADGTVSQHVLPSRTVVWAAGVAASPLGRALANSSGCTLDRAGRVVVEPDLSVPGHPEIQVVGDLAAAKSYPPKGEPTAVPGVSPGAKQMGRTAAANLLRRLKGEPTRRFRYVRAGHPPLIHIRGGEARACEQGGDVPVGVSEDAFYRDLELALEPGDALVLLTDGVLETLNEEGEEFGLSRVLETLGGGAERSIQRTVAALALALEEFRKQEPRRDDVTVVGVRV